MGDCEFRFYRTCLYYIIVKLWTFCIMLLGFYLAYYLLSLDKLRVYCVIFFFFLVE